MHNNFVKMDIPLNDNDVIEVLTLLNFRESPEEWKNHVWEKLFDNVADDDTHQIELITRSIFNHLLPYLLMVTDEGRPASPATIPANFIRLRDLAAEFILQITEEFGDSITKLMYALLQRLCAKVIDRGDYRTKISQIIITFSSELPVDTFQLFIKWLDANYSRNSKVGYRVFAVDVALSLFNVTLKKLNDDDEEIRTEAAKSLEVYIRLIIGRCADAAASVRCRALASLSQIVENTFNRIKARMAGDGDGDLIRKLLSDFVEGDVNVLTNVNQPTTNGEQEATDEDNEAMEIDGGAAEHSGSTPTHRSHSTPPAPMTLLQRILLRCNDEKPLVRKSAVHALEFLVRLFPQHLNKDVVTVFEARCMDTLLSVRKQALESITAMLDIRHGEYLEKSWTTHALALVVDQEKSVYDKCVDVFQETVICHLHSENEDGQRAWRLMGYIASDSTTTRYAQRLIHEAKNVITRELITSIDKATEDPARSSAAWFLSSELATHSRMDANRLKEIWASGTMNGNDFNYVTKIIAAKAETFSRPMLDYFESDLKRQLLSFSLSPEHIAEIFKAYWMFASVEEADFDDWCRDIANDCVHYLSPLAYNTTDQETDGSFISQRSDDDIIRHLFTLGELFQLCPQLTVNGKNYYMIMALISVDRVPEVINDRPESALNVSLSQESAMRALRENISFSSNVRSHAIVALGKLCLQDEHYAKKTVAALVSELDSSPDRSIRNNIMVLLSDLCLRYTLLIDRHIGRISRRLRDPSALIRKQTLTLLTNLLKEDYLKWRGALLFRFVTVIMDSDSEIRTFAEFCLTDILLPRKPDMFFVHFLECLFYYNDARHPFWCDSVDAESQDHEAFALSGPEKQTRRLFLYRFILNQFNDQQRFDMSLRMCEQILGAVVDKTVPLDDVSEQVLADSLIVLASKEMKLNSLKKPIGGDDLEDEELETPDPVALAIAERAKHAISQKVKQAAMEEIVPTLMSLKEVLRSQRRNHLKYLVGMYFAELAKDYKTEIEEILATDKMILKEIEYDKKMQKKKGSTPVQLPLSLS